MSDSQRDYLKDSLRQECERTIEERVDRYLAVGHQRVIGLHHFAHASTECIKLFRDCYFTTCVMATQAVADGIIEFVAARNGFSKHQGETKEELACRMQVAGIVPDGLVQALVSIRRRFRNDIHHMNPPVGQIAFAPLAKESICDLAIIEREIFGCAAGPEGTLVPQHRLYWDIAEDGTVPAYVRFS